MKVLLIEDDNLLGQGICTGLQRENYDVQWARDGETGRQLVCDPGFDVVILDLGLPRVSGIDILRFARKQQCTVPVLILTAQDAVEHRIAGLDAGADDYMTKPFSFEEMCARLRALIRRSVGAVDECLHYRDIIINVSTHEVTQNGEPVELSQREFALLLELVSSAGRVLSKTQLEQRLYGWLDEIGSNTIEVYIHHIRKKLGSDVIQTVRGVGYKAAHEHTG